MRNIILELHEIEAIKFGSFILSSGLSSPIYIDLRRAISHPTLLQQIAERLAEKVEDLSFDLVAGVPYAAVPLATAFSLAEGIPLIMCRKQAKEHGTKKMIEGIFTEGQTCLLIEDIVTTGKGILEAIESMRQGGLHVRDIAVVFDRQQGGSKGLEEQGFRVHALCTLREVLATLLETKRIDVATVDSVTRGVYVNT